MSEILTVEDIRRSSGWREALEERQNYERERRKRELAKAKAHEAEKQQVATNNLDELVAVIDERVRGWFDYYFSDQSGGNDRRGFYADWIAKGLAGIRDMLRGEFNRAIEKQQCSFETKLAALEQRQASNNGRIEATLAHERDVLSEVTGGVRAQRDEIKHALGEMCDAFGAQLAALEERLKAMPGRLPVVKIWRQESVGYRSEFVCHEGALWQACKDTAQAPGSGSDWICVARAGRDGCDGLTPNIRGTFNAYKKYRQLDIVSFDGAAFIACRDHPRICPGDGWQALAVRGKAGDRGPPGPRGTKGERGARGGATPTILNWTIDPVHYRAVPTMSDGTVGASLDLRPLFEAYNLATS